MFREKCSLAFERLLKGYLDYYYTVRTVRVRILYRYAYVPYTITKQLFRPFIRTTKSHLP